MDTNFFLKMKKINLAIFTVGRSDYGIMRNIIISSQSNKYLNSSLFITGNHSSKIFGNTIQEIKKDKIKQLKYININYKKNLTNNTINYFAELLVALEKKIKNSKIDYALILGDRYEMLANALVCFNRNIKILHFGGGSDTLGAHDDQYRYAISKMAYYHFVETRHHKLRLIQNGISSKNIKIIGAPALENIEKINFLDKQKLLNKLNIPNDGKKIYVSTFHPETVVEIKKNKHYFKIMLQVLSNCNESVILTYPNADAGYMEYVKILKNFEKKNKNFYVFKNLGVVNYYNLLKYADLLIGNSSSGIIESSSFKLPTINIGIRQKNRFCAKNVVHTKFNKLEISKAIRKITKDRFNRNLNKLLSPYRLRLNSNEILKEIIKLNER
jgi:GDP/UDP-N,N'-diacetylbacillosamine 2-epimerase (hydrolysing)